MPEGFGSGVLENFCFDGKYSPLKTSFENEYIVNGEPRNLANSMVE